MKTNIQKISSHSKTLNSTSVIKTLNFVECELEMTLTYYVEYVERIIA